MADKRINPISDDLKNKNPSQDSPADGATQVPVNNQSAQPQPDSSPPPPPASDTSPDEGTTPPAESTIKPFTMDDPAQTVAPPTQEAPASQDGTPKAFTMDNQTSTPQATPATAAPAPASQERVNATEPKVIGPQQSAPPDAAPQQTAPSPTPPASPTPNQGATQNIAASSTDEPASVEPVTPTPAAPANEASPSTPQPSGSPAASGHPNLQADGNPAKNANETTSGDSKGFLSSKKALLIAGATALVLIGSLGFVFGYYLPNRPENVYSAGLERTGEALQELTSRSLQAETIEELSRLEISGDINVSAEDMELEGDFRARFEEGKSDSRLSIAMNDGMNNESIEIGGDVITDIADGNQFPDVFFRTRGLAALGAELFLPGIGQFEDEWIHIDAEYIKEAFDEAELDEESIENVTVEDVAEVSDEVMNVANEYVFSAGDNAVFELDEIAGEDEFDGIRTFRYEVSINETNARAFCSRVTEVIFDSTLYEKLATASSDEEIAEAKTEAQAECDDLELDEDAPDITMWVDRDTRLIHKLRFTEADNSDSYLEIGQRYDGGDEFELFLVMNTPENNSNSELVMTFNTETNVSSAVFSYSQEDETFGDTSVNINTEARPMSDSVEITRPSDATSFEDFLEAVMGGFMTPPPQEFDEFDEDEFIFEEPQPQEEPAFIETMNRLFQ